MIKAIDPNQLLTQMRALQAQASQSEQVNNVTAQGASGRVDFANMMKSAVDYVNDAQKTSSEMKVAFEMGDPNVNLVDVMIASQKANLAFEATLQVRKKMIEAYQEVMRMSV